MANEMQSLSDRIAERVGQELVDLIPEDDWKRLIDTQVEHFLRHTAPKIVQEVLGTELRKRVANKLSSGQYADTWDSMTNRMTNEAVNEMLKRTAPEVFAAMLEPVMSGMMQELRNRLTGTY